jgi:hypothetical protein
MLRNLIKSLLTNRFGIVLGTLNVVYFFNQLICPPSFSTTPSKIIFLCINLPALVGSALPSTLIESLFNLSHVAPHQVRIFSFAFFMMVQWLLIAHLARVFAKRIADLRFGKEHFENNF